MIGGTCWLDFETKSRCDLTSRGAYNYAKDPSTGIICMSYAFDDDDVATWDPATGDPFPQWVADHIAAGGEIRAHNAAFERLIFWYVVCPDYGVPEPTIEQFYCTAAQARCNAFPASLEDVGRASGSSMRKDYRGSELIRLLSIPREDGTFLLDDDLLDEMMDYCDQDVRTMREVSKWLRQMTPEELLDYHINEHINDRGIKLDRPLAEAATRYAAAETEEIQKLVVELTEGAVTSVRSPKLRAWVMARVGDEAIKLMTVYKDGVKKFSIDKSVRANLLILADEDPDQVPELVADVIQCTDDLWASSVAKFASSAGIADEEDDRVRGAFLFAGASATGRDSSKGCQLHNYPRDCAKEAQKVRDAMVAGDPIVPTYGPRVTDVLKGMLRPSLIPEPGNVFVVADWAGIEARGLPWLSRSPMAESVLDVFRRGDDIYITAANGIFHINGSVDAEGELVGITKQQRQVGKVAILSLGYGGAANAFMKMAKNYKVLLPENEVARIVKGWRAANPWAVTFWHQAESAALYAMRHLNREFRAGGLLYLFDGRHLWCMLPSGRLLCYPFARLEDGGITYMKAAWKPKADATEWPRARAWHGTFVENGTQAICNDILRHSRRRFHADGVPMVAHVHDEVVVECRREAAPAMKDYMEKVMTTPPDWCPDFPLSVEIKIMDRYGK